MHSVCHFPGVGREIARPGVREGKQDMNRGPMMPPDDSRLAAAIEELVPAIDLRRLPAESEPTGRPIDVDLFETERELVVIASLPGASVDDLQVTVTEHVLTIQGTIPGTADAAEAGRWIWYLHEIPDGQFARTIDLPVPVDPEGARATLQDGLLRLELPKATPVRSRRIPLQSAPTDG